MTVIEHLHLGDGPDAVRASCYHPPGGAAEWHLCLGVMGGEGRAGLAALRTRYHDALAQWGLSRQTEVFRRWYVSDPTILDGVGPGIGQAPLPGRAPALWAYHVQHDGSPGVERFAGGTLLRRPGRGHLWLGGGVAPDAGDIGDQTRTLFAALADRLADHGATLRDQLVRTWIYVDDIDHQYRGMVDVRRALFAEHGLTQQTHYVASTGIAGRPADPTAALQLDAIAVIGLDPAQVRYLTAPDHLGPTHRYGVTFERGTRVEYGDRAHVWISGTAAIDGDGRSRHPGDVRAQLCRSLDNVEALLQDAGATAADVVQALVYVRRPGDEPALRDELARRLPGVPRLTLHGAVCRPEWLVETECLAIVDHRAPRWPDF